MSEQTNTTCLPDNAIYFQELKQTPPLSIPAFGLFVFAIGLMIWAAYMAISAAIPYWVATLISGTGMYLIFSAMHESLHRNLSSNQLINESLGRITMLLLIPLAPLEVGRWIHLEHHRFTSCENDPDNFMHHGRWWQLVFRWANFDLYYIIYFMRHGGKQKQLNAKEMIVSVLVFVGLIVTLTLSGYGKEILFLWLLPSRIGLCLVGFTFVFMPHYPAHVSAEEDRYQATTIRRGWEWLLTPLLVYQNYHLIHHLYPTAPFYNYIKIFHLKYDELIANNPAIQEGFGLTPVNYVGNSTAT